MLLLAGLLVILMLCIIIIRLCGGRWTCVIVIADIGFICIGVLFSSHFYSNARVGLLFPSSAFPSGYGSVKWKVRESRRDCTVCRLWLDGLDCWVYYIIRHTGGCVYLLYFLPEMPISALVLGWLYETLVICVFV
jgi:hypothetical protein